MNAATLALMNETMLRNFFCTVFEPLPHPTTKKNCSGESYPNTF